MIGLCGIIFELFTGFCILKTIFYQTFHNSFVDLFKYRCYGHLTTCVLSYMGTRQLYNYIFQVDLRCQHNNTKSLQELHNQRSSSKNTGCPATMTIVVKRTMISKDRLSRFVDTFSLEHNYWW